MMHRTESMAIMAGVKPEDIVERECKHVTYVRSDPGQDALIAKLYLTLKDGRRIPHLAVIENYKRPYWLTKPHLRTHPQKIQYESLDNVDMFAINQANLANDICFKLGKGKPNTSLRRLARAGESTGGQFMYGLDIGPEVFYKQKYQEKWPDAFKPNTVAVIDCETDVWGDELPILWSLVSEEGCKLYINEAWSAGEPDIVERIFDEFKLCKDDWFNQIKDKFKDKNGNYPKWIDTCYALDLEIVSFKDSLGITLAMIDDLHELQPDIVTGWNINFDMTVIEKTLKTYELDPSDVLSDPRVPRHYRNAYIKKGLEYKVTDSNREMRLAPQERWDICLTSSSWRVCCAMQIHWQLRKAKGKESGGYGLDAVLKRQLGAGKVNGISATSSVPEGILHWHMDMQKNYKVPYSVYSVFDSLGLYVKDAKDSDLSMQISMLAGPVDYSSFNSQPTINTADMFFTALKEMKQVMCSTSDDMSEEVDKYLFGKDGWIVTLPPHTVVKEGLAVLADMPHIRSTLHRFASDIDVETTYPKVDSLQGVDKETTMREPGKIKGICTEVQRHASINLTGGHVNAINIMQTICGMPTLGEWLEQARRDLKR